MQAAQRRFGQDSKFSPRMTRWVVLMLAVCGLSACDRSMADRARSTATLPMDAATLCGSALGTNYLNSAPTTVGDIRHLSIGPPGQPYRGSFAGLDDNRIAAWCWTGSPGGYTLYAVAQGRPPLRIEGVTVSQTPAPGPALIP